MRLTPGLLGLGALAMFAGCSSHDRMTSDTAPYEPTPEPARHETAPPLALSEWPENAQAGACYAKVFVPAKLGTVSERVCVREASERVEITPARYEWVDEQVLVKDASVQLEEVPAEFRSQDRVLEITPGQTGWIMQSCAEGGQVARDVYCFVSSSPVQRTVRTYNLVKATCLREVAVPAEYQTVRRQKLAAPATTRTVAVAAEYETVEKSVVLAAGHMEWQRVACDAATAVGTANAVKSALLAAGFTPGPLNGELGAQDWSAIQAYQAANGLGIGGLSDETLDSLQVAAK